MVRFGVLDVVRFGGGQHLVLDIGLDESGLVDVWLDHLGDVGLRQQLLNINWIRLLNFHRKRLIHWVWLRLGHGNRDRVVANLLLRHEREVTTGTEAIARQTTFVEAQMLVVDLFVVHGQWVVDYLVLEDMVRFGMRVDDLRLMVRFGVWMDNFRLMMWFGVRMDNLRLMMRFGVVLHQFRLRVWMMDQLR